MLDEINDRLTYKVSTYYTNERYVRKGGKHHHNGRENATQHNAYIIFSLVSLLFIAFVVHMTLNTTTKHTTLI